MATPTEAKVDNSKVVTFVTEVFPFVRGDVINLANFTKEELAKVTTAHYIKGEVAFADLPAKQEPEEE